MMTFSPSMMPARFNSASKSLAMGSRCKSVGFPDAIATAMRFFAGACCALASGMQNGNNAAPSSKWRRLMTPPKAPNLYRPASRESIHSMTRSPSRWLRLLPILLHSDGSCHEAAQCARFPHRRRDILLAVRRGNGHALLCSRLVGYPGLLRPHRV